MNPSPCATYFPFTHITRSLLEVLSLCFARVVLYQPVGSRPDEDDEDLTPWIDRGIVDIRVPFEAMTNQGTITDKLESWKDWGAFHQDADLAYLKEMGDALSAGEPLIPKLASEIRNAGIKKAEKGHSPDLTAQLFLLLAEDFDRQSLDIRNQLKKIGQRQQELQAFFRIDSPDDVNNAKAQARSDQTWSHMTDDLGSVMTSNRVTAWNHLFQKDPVSLSILVTDSPSACGFLLENQDDKIELLHFDIFDSQDQSRGRIYQDHLDTLFADILTNPWNEQLNRRVEETRQQILKETAAAEKRKGDIPDMQATFRWYLIPNLGTAALLDQKCECGAAHTGKEPAKNTLVCLISGQQHSLVV